MSKRRFVSTALVLAGLSTSALGANGDAGGFYKDKTITIVTSTGPGGAYDLAAREIARIMPRYIPGRPTIIVENMPGAGNVLATNYMYNIAPKDGTMIATIHEAMPLYQALHGRGVRFHAENFKWFGSTSSQNEVILVWHTAGVRDFQDALRKQVIMGTTGTGSGISLIPAAMNSILGTKFKLVVGYKSSEDVNLAMESGEVQGRAFSIDSVVGQHPDWIRDKKVFFIAQAGVVRDRNLPNTPLLTELAAADRDRATLQLISTPAAFGIPFVAPPGVPQGHLEILQRAFDATLRDPDLQTDFAKSKLSLNPTSGEELAKLAKQVIDAPLPVVAAAEAAVGSFTFKPRTDIPKND